VRRQGQVLFAIAALCSFFALGAGSALAAGPALTVEPTSAITYTSAHLSGTVNPEGAPNASGLLVWTLEYTTEPAGTWTPGPSGFLFAPESEGNTPIAVGGDVEGLEPGATYFLRLSTNDLAGGETFSPEPNPSFATTAFTAPEVERTGALPSSSEAELEASIALGSPQHELLDRIRADQRLRLADEPEDDPERPGQSRRQGNAARPQSRFDLPLQVRRRKLKRTRGGRRPDLPDLRGRRCRILPQRRDPRAAGIHVPAGMPCL
jgi:hypothetical protein